MRTARPKDDGVLVGLTAAAALAAGLLAVHQHADCTSAGYDLAVAERENVELRRTASLAERRVAALRTPQAAMQRAASMKLGALKYPKTWNVVSGKTVSACMETAPAAGAATPAVAESRNVATPSSSPKAPATFVSANVAPKGGGK